MGARLLTKALNAVLEVEETRPAWKRVAFSVDFALGVALAGIAAAGLMLVISRVTAWLAYYVGFCCGPAANPCDVTSARARHVCRVSLCP
jgi:uncharacterized BrkB/YihY/UPF0761 family membrane protein